MENRLRDLLQALHRELEHGPAVDDTTRDLLRTVLGDISAALDTPRAERPAEPESFGRRLRDATWHLEASHPKLAATVEQLAETLSRVFQ